MLATPQQPQAGAHAPACCFVCGFPLVPNLEHQITTPLGRPLCSTECADTQQLRRWFALAEIDPFTVDIFDPDEQLRMLKANAEGTITAVSRALLCKVEDPEQFAKALKEAHSECTAPRSTDTAQTAETLSGPPSPPTSMT